MSALETFISLREGNRKTGFCALFNTFNPSVWRVESRWAGHKCFIKSLCTLLIARDETVKSVGCSFFFSFFFFLSFFLTFFKNVVS